MTETFIASPIQLMIAAVLGIALLLMLIIKCKLHALLALLLSGLFIGFGVGLPQTMLMDAVSTGISKTLGNIALLVGLGSMFGSILSGTGAIETLANVMVEKFGRERAIFAIGITGLLVGIPVFYDAAFVILFPLAVKVAQKAEKPILTYVMAMVAGVGIGQLIPPTVGPIMLSGILGVDLGSITVVAVAVAIPAWLIVGYGVSTFVGKRLPAAQPQIVLESEADPSIKKARFGTVLFVMLLPILLILLDTGSSIINSEAPAVKTMQTVFSFIGEPWVALLISNLVALAVLGLGRGFKAEQLQKLMGESLQPVATILLVTAAGGVLRYILEYSGAGTIIGDAFAQTSIPIAVAAFVITCLIRIAIGSGSVACAMGGGIIASMPQIAAMTPMELAVVVLAIGGGAFSCSHVNDSGFWMFKEFLNVDVKTGLKAWLAYSCSLGVVCLLASMLLSIIF